MRTASVFLFSVGMACLVGGPLMEFIEWDCAELTALAELAQALTLNVGLAFVALGVVCFAWSCSRGMD